jgi:hypothetical protein
MTGSLSTSDVVLIGSTLFLGIVALVTPSFASIVGRWWNRPKLTCDFQLSRHACHKTELEHMFGTFHRVRDPVFIYRIQVGNSGRTQARRCEVVVEGLEAADAAGQFRAYVWNTPVSLVWGSGYADFVDINPGRKFYCDLLSVPSESYQKAKVQTIGGWVDPPGLAPFPLGVILTLRAAFFSQPDRLPPGRYRLHLAIYAENADTIRPALTLAWSGEWRDDEDSFFRECVVGVAA